MLARVLRGHGGGEKSERYIHQLDYTTPSIYLTKNSNVKVLKFFSYLWVDLETIREVNWNDANFTTILLLCGGGTHMCEWGMGRGGGGREKRRYQSTH